MICGKCKGYNRDGLKFCTGCGGELVANLCPQGHPMPAGTTECPHCPTGGRQQTTVEAPEDLSAFSHNQKRAGTVMVDPGELPGGGSAPIPQGVSGLPSGARSGTLFRPPQDPKQTTNNAPHSVRASDISNSGQSPLVGFLVSYTTDKNGLFWPLRIGRTKIGSTVENDIVFVHSEISGHHMTIIIRGQPGKLKIFCSDENSMNGTLLNGEDIANEKPSLSHGDVISVGPVEAKLFLLDM